MHLFLLLLFVWLTPSTPQVRAGLEEIRRGSIGLHAYSDSTSFWVGIETTSKADDAVVQVEYWEQSNKGLLITNRVLQVDLGLPNERESGTIVPSPHVQAKLEFIKDVKITLLRGNKKLESQQFEYRQSPPENPSRASPPAS
jgi:hypothetical protein